MITAGHIQVQRRTIMSKMEEASTSANIPKRVTPDTQSKADGKNAFCSAPSPLPRSLESGELASFLAAYSGERLVGMPELCWRLNIKSRSTIYKHIESGLIKKPHRIGRHIGWPSSYVDSLVTRS
jgi:predicted DNA-binding transcriptional regulator AlpA